MAKFYMDAQSAKFLRDYAEHLGKHFVLLPEFDKRFAVEVPDDCNIVECEIIKTELIRRAEQQVVKLRLQAIYETEGATEDDELIPNVVSSVYQHSENNSNIGTAAFANATHGIDNLTVELGAFLKYPLPAVAAFNSLKDDLQATGFYLYREGFTPPTDDEEDEDE